MQTRRLHPTYGIGYSPHEALIERLAEVPAGTAEELLAFRNNPENHICIGDNVFLDENRAEGNIAKLLRFKSEGLSPLTPEAQTLIQAVQPSKYSSSSHDNSADGAYSIFVAQGVCPELAQELVNAEIGVRWVGEDTN